jgi:hypothetical protein
MKTAVLPAEVIAKRMRTFYLIEARAMLGV